MLMETRDLDMELLRTFVAAAERESFAVAAARVFRTQAAVSLQMQRLEAVVGCALFTRVGRNKRLSDQGVRLLEYARRILSLNDEAYRAMTQEVFEYPVKIGACADAVDTLMPEYLEMCAETYPSLRIDIQVGRSRWLASALRRAGGARWGWGGAGGLHRRCGGVMLTWWSTWRRTRSFITSCCAPRPWCGWPGRAFITSRIWRCRWC